MTCDPRNCSIPADECKCKYQNYGKRLESLLTDMILENEVKALSRARGKVSNKATHIMEVCLNDEIGLDATVVQWSVTIVLNGPRLKEHP